MRDERLRLMWEMAVDAMILLDPSGIVVDANPSYYSLNGYTPEEILGRRFDVIFPAEERAFVAERFTAMFAREREEILPAYDFQIERKDGTRCTVEGRVSFLEEDGARSLMLAMLRDVSDRVRIQESLRQSEEHFRLLIENALDIITIIEADGTIRYESPSVERVLGFTQDELVGRNAFEMIHPDDLPGVIEIYLEALNVPGMSSGAEFRYLNSAGEWIYLQTIGTNLLEHPAIHGLVLNSRDVTARRLAEQSLQEMNELLEHRVTERTSELALALKRLEEAHLAQKRFIADASHDLRTPLTVLRSEIDLLAMGETVSGEVAEALERMGDEVSLLDQLTSDLLMLARLDSERLQMRSEVDLAALVATSVDFLSPIAADKGLEWDLRIGEVGTILGDERALARAIRNVLENAIKYSEPSSTIDVRVDVEDDAVVVEVCDRGIAIPAEELERVFERFYRSDRTRSTPGSGLGLAIVRSVVEAHDGSARMTSDETGETRVTIRLPRKSSEPLARSTP
jgi:PAS domain S-box-containing protein